MTPFAQHLWSEEMSALAPVEKTRILLNPHSSTKQRDIPPKLAFELVKSLKRKIDDIFVSSGVPGNPKDAKWIADFMRLIEEDRCRISVEIIPHVPNLTILHQEIETRQINFAITADTALSHFLIERRTPHVVMVNESFWDLHSPQSVATMFVRDSVLQIPVYFHPDECETEDFNQSLAENVAQLLEQMSCDRKVLSPIFETIFYQVQDVIKALEATYLNPSFSDPTVWTSLAKVRELFEVSGQQEQFLAFLLEQSKRPWILRFEEVRNSGITQLAWAHSGLSKIQNYISQ